MVTIPGTGTSGGYEIWRFADSTLYLKFEYGTAGTSNYPQMWVTVGTGSNGSGTITGTNQTSTRNIFTFGQVVASSVANYTSYMSATANHFAVVWKANGAAGSPPTPVGFLVVGKTVDGTGAATTTGYAVLRMGQLGANCELQSVRLIATAAVGTATTKFCLVPNEPASSLDAAGNYQCYMSYMTVPDALPFMWASAVNFNDLPLGTTFSVAQVGATARTYLSCGPISAFGSISVNNHSATRYSWAMLYE